VSEVHEQASRDRIKLARETLDAFLRGDLETALAPASEKIISVRTAPLPDPQVYHGPDGIVAMWNDWTSQFSEFVMTIESAFEVGDRVIADVLQRGIGRASGAEVEGRIWLRYTFEGDEVVRFEAFATEAQARAGQPG
jgi:ketosteroid isomerase-like protein